MFNPFLVAIVAIVAWALVQMSRNRADGASVADLEAELLDLADALEDAEAERRRLTERVQNLEAIVTTETYDLARQEQPKTVGRIDPPEDEETPEEEAARLARRIKT